MKNKIITIVVGLLFILGAAAYAANHFFGLENINLFFDGWWTVFIIVPAVAGLFKRGSRVFSFCLLLVGLCLLAKYQPWFPAVSAALADIGVWPMIVTAGLLFVGLSIIFSGFHKGEVHFDFGSPQEIKPDSDKSVSNIFGERRISFDGLEFTGYEINSIFGELILDLRGAVIPGDCTINASSVFGSVVIYAGDNAVVAVGKNTIFGSVDCKSTAADSSLPVVTVKADAIFGSVEIK